ncbi:MAG TPA: T9SS type A sorting domain-containing protein [Bacteroidia bacterium]|nr:T9SS type A sorting domain-containing protein [Bacteroidia bacterium]
MLNAFLVINRKVKSRLPRFPRGCVSEKKLLFILRSFSVVGLLFFFLLSQLCFAQNLVPNPSFEDTVACPTSADQINRAAGWSSYRGTPDYFHSCNNGNFGVPSNYWGFQFARTGIAYAGFATFLSTAEFREYIGIQLTQPLTIGQQYFVSFFVSWGDYGGPYYRVATNNIGINLSTLPFSASGNPLPIDNNSLVYTSSIISDSINWTKISGSFVADSSYNFFSIGNFFVDSLTSHTSLDTLPAIAYYYVDDICLSTDSLLCNEIIKGVVEYNENYSIKIFPNPAHDWINIKGSDIKSLSLYNILGGMIYSFNSEIISPTRINTSSFPKGIYLLKVVKNNITIIQKIILQ